MSEVQVQRRASDTGQKRVAEKRRLDHAGGTDPQAGQHRIGLRVGVEQRQVNQMYVPGAQVFMGGVDASTP